MKRNYLKTGMTFAVCVAIPLLVGLVSSFLSQDAMLQFDQMNKPLLAPPGWLFPIVWTILYVMMGVASFLIYTKRPATIEGQKSRCLALMLYGFQLLFNFMWCILFFRWHAYVLAFVFLFIMWMLILWIICHSIKVSKMAAVLLMPYLCWCTFAGYLNIMIGVLN